MVIAIILVVALGGLVVYNYLKNKKVKEARDKVRSKKPAKPRRTPVKENDPLQDVLDKEKRDYYANNRG